MELRELLMEVRALRAQLEHSVQENSALRIQLQKQLDQSVELRPSPIFPVSPLRDAFYRRQLLHGNMHARSFLCFVLQLLCEHCHHVKMCFSQTRLPLLRSEMSALFHLDLCTPRSQSWRRML